MRNATKKKFTLDTQHHDVTLSAVIYLSHTCGLKLNRYLPIFQYVIQLVWIVRIFKIVFLPTGRWNSYYEYGTFVLYGTIFIRKIRTMNDWCEPTN
jgi:hypothetical protein